MTSGDGATAGDSTEGGFIAGSDIDLDDMSIDDDIDPELAKAMAAEMAEARARIADTPAEDLIANHVMGLFEIAAINLSAAQPSLFDAALAIDAMGAIVEGVGVERLGQHGPTLADALSQIRMAFVHVKQALVAPNGQTDQSAGDEPAHS
jgi:hypothetical protein